MQISPNFDLDEFARSATAARLGRSFRVPALYLPNVTRLCLEVLEPLRAAVALPITILSGFRPLWLNVRVGGSPVSDHLTASAADVVIKGLRAEQIAERVRTLDLPVKQCILEFDEWVHVSVPPDGIPPKREYLTARKIGGRTVYLRGIVPREPITIQAGRGEA